MDRAIAVVLVLWNLVGVAAFGAQATADLDALALTDPVQAEAFRSMPAWVWGAYGIAVTAGTAGAIALLARRRLAVGAFAASLAGELAQFGWTFFGTSLLAQKGGAVLVFPAVIVGVTAASLGWAVGRAGTGALR